MIYRQVYHFVLMKSDRRLSGMKIEFTGRKSTLASFYTRNLWMLDLAGKVCTSNCDNEPMDTCFESKNEVLH